MDWESWEALMEEGHRATIQTFADQYINAGSRVLDLGCGPGGLTIKLLSGVDPAEVIGVDISIEQLREGEEAGNDLKFACGDAERLPFADGSFDAVVAIAALHHPQTGRRL